MSSNNFQFEYKIDENTKQKLTNHMLNPFILQLGNRNFSNQIVDDDGREVPGQKPVKKRFGYNAPEELIEEAKLQGGENDDHEDIFKTSQQRVSDSQNSYVSRQYQRKLEGKAYDAFSDDANQNATKFSDKLLEQRLDNERVSLEQKIAKDHQQTEYNSRFSSGPAQLAPNAPLRQPVAGRPSASSKFSSDVDTDTSFSNAGASASRLGSKWGETPKKQSGFESTPVKRQRWDQTPQQGGFGQTPSKVGGMFGETPTPGHLIQGTPSRFGETPTPKRSTTRTRWDESTPKIAQTPMGGYMGITPTPGGLYTPQNQPNLTPEQIMNLKQMQINEIRNRPLTDDDLDQMLPGTNDGYEIVKPPDNYNPPKNAMKQLLLQQQTPSMNTPHGYQIPDEMTKPIEVPQSPSINGLPSIKPEDLAIFGELQNEVNESELTSEELKRRKIKELLLKIKRGTPQMRKSALRQITQNARDFGADLLFNDILTLLMSPTLEVQERHLLVKVIDRILYKLDDLVRPHVHNILVVIEPLLIDEDYYARVEGREIISNLAKAAGLPTMIKTLKPDIDHNDEFVRNTTARAFAVVASSLGISSMLPFLKPVCKSKKSWYTRHTGIKIVQQIAILMGCAVLPHLRSLVEIIEHGLKDEQNKVRTITSLALAALAEAATPYGIDAFASVLIPLWEGITQYKGKSLAAFLKAIGFIIPLMDADRALEYTKEVMEILRQEFSNTEDEMRKIVLKVVKQCVSCQGVDASYIREHVVPEFFKQFWVQRMANDKNSRQLIDTTIEIATKVGGSEILESIVPDLKSPSEPYRKMVMETIEKIVAALGVSDVDNRLEEQLMDGIISAFHEQNSEDTGTMLNGFGTCVNALGQRAKPYFSQICGIIQWRLNNKSARVRQQAADLISRIALCMKNCSEENRLGKLGLLLYESLGEEYPEVLGSILGGLKAIVNVIGMTKMTPPIKDLLPRLTPILKNRHEKVQENSIDLIGRISDRGAEHVSPKEWMRICFDLLDLLKAHKKGIRRATVNTFGYIAKAIGPQDVLVTLLNNLKVQERQLRVCTTVAIAIVAETCGPFTVLPALMNEYRVQELNVQNGVLKSLSFMFEYIGEMAKNYIQSIITLLEDALTDRDPVHRQTAASAVKHLALGVSNLGCEDCLIHLLNFIWPNIFETSPHVITAVTEAIDAFRIALGPGVILLYLLQGLYHPAKRVRQVYWKLYNMLYVGSQDSLIAFYPTLEDDEGEDRKQYTYARNELQLML